VVGSPPVPAPVIRARPAGITIDVAQVYDGGASLIGSIRRP
jgi:hypothetical protein